MFSSFTCESGTYFHASFCYKMECGRKKIESDLLLVIFSLVYLLNLI